MIPSHRSVLFRAWYALSAKRAAFRYWALLEDAQSANRAALARRVRARLVRILRHCAIHVPYYRSRVSELGLQLNEGSLERELPLLPIVGKDTLRSEFEALCSEAPGPKSYRNTSGGSTGEPAVFLQDGEYLNWAFATKFLFASWAGWRPGEPRMKIWGVPAETFDQVNGLKQRVRAYMRNEYIFNCYKIREGTWDEVRRIINKRRPVIIETYADAIDDFSRTLVANNSDVHSPRGVITSAGILHDEMRARISSVFRCPVLNRYGSREVGDVACSCGAGNGLHVNPLTHYVEILNDAGKECEPGQEGDVVVTLLTNYTMPLIRYRIGDRAVWSGQPCPCGRSSPTLARVVGRTCEYLTAVDGTKVNGTALTTLLYGIAGIRRYQFRQTGPRDLSLMIVPTDDTTAPELHRHLEPAHDRLAALLGQDMKVCVDIRDDIELTATGKHRYIINELISSR